jgi:hypothetical protein
MNRILNWSDFNLNESNASKLPALAKDETVIDKVSDAFVSGLIDEIGDAKFKNVVKMNADEHDPGICHSHDECDANMVMSAAIKKVTGIDLEADLDLIQNEDLIKLWNEAWDKAKEKMQKK